MKPNGFNSDNHYLSEIWPKMESHIAKVVVILVLLQLKSKLTSTTDVNSLLSLYCPTPRECRIDQTGDGADVFNKQTPHTNETEISGKTIRQCLACSCDSFCEYKNNCCPSSELEDWEDYFPIGRGSSFWPPITEMEETTEPRLNFTCIIPRSNVDRTPGRTDSVADGLGLYMVTSCCHGMEDKRCTEPTKNVFEENLPQISLNTSITYRNKFCGECNNDTFMLPWKPYITCSDSHLLKADEALFPISVEKLYQLAVSSPDGDCGIEFHPPDKFDESRDMCYKRELVQTCISDDIDLKEACKSFSMPYFHTENNVTVAYANVFCYLCKNNSQLANNNFDETLRFPRFANTLVGELNVNNDNARDKDEFTFLDRELAERYESYCEPGLVYDPFEVSLGTFFFLFLQG